METKEDKTICVYKATFENGKCYIGITSNFIRRKACHRRDAMSDSKTAFSNAIRKYGFENIKWEVLSEHESYESAGLEEIRLIELTKPNYNIAVGGKNYGYSREISERLGKSRRGIRKTKEAKSKISTSKTHNLEQSKDSKIKDQFIEDFKNGVLSETVVNKLNKLKSTYIEGMSLAELSDLSGVSKTTTLRYQWMWLEEYIPQGKKVYKKYKIKKNCNKDIRWKQKSNNRLKRHKNILNLLRIETKDKTNKEISKESGIDYFIVKALKRVWEDIIEEEGF